MKKSTEQGLLSYRNSNNKKGTSQPSPVHDHNQEKQEMQFFFFLNFKLSTLLKRHLVKEKSFDFHLEKGHSFLSVK